MSRIIRTQNFKKRLSGWVVSRVTIDMGRNRVRREYRLTWADEPWMYPVIAFPSRQKAQEWADKHPLRVRHDFKPPKSELKIYYVTFEIRQLSSVNHIVFHTSAKTRDEAIERAKAAWRRTGDKVPAPHKFHARVSKIQQPERLSLTSWRGDRAFAYMVMENFWCIYVRDRMPNERMSYAE